METPIQEFAEALKTQREARGLTLDDLFRRTRISPEWLKAIETGRFHILPPIYTRLFLKTYAREIGLDVEEVIKHYETIAPATPSAQTPPLHKRTASPVAIIALSLALIGTLALVAWQINEYAPADPAMPLDMAAPPASFQPQPPAPPAEATREIPPASPPPQPQTLPAPSPVPTAQPVQEPAPQTPPTASPVPAQPIPESQTLPAPSPVPTAQPVQEPAPQTPPRPSSTPVTQPVSEPPQPDVEPDTSRVLTAYDMPLPADLSGQETMTLAGFVRENTHVSVFADGQTVFDGALRVGSQPRWQARDSFRLYILRTGAIALSLQNQVFALPSAPDQRLRMLVNRTRIRVEELASPPTNP